MSGLGWLIKDYVEMCAGKIQWRNYLYLFVSAHPRKQRLRNWKQEEWAKMVDADGREFTAFTGLGAHCSHPDLWLGRLPRIERKGATHYIVPVAECKACQYHEGGRFRRYACCLWDRERRKGYPSPSQLAADSIRKAEAIVSAQHVEPESDSR